MPRADAIVVLGCRIAPCGRPGPAASRRAAAAAAAYLAGVAPLVVVSGGRRWGSTAEARAMSAAIQAAGVPPHAIVEELCSLSTRENALLSAGLLRARDAHRAAIVTCPWHLPRALANFRAAGIDPIPVPAASVPAPLTHRVYLRAHELVCTWLDARAARRTSLLSRPCNP